MEEVERGGEVEVKEIKIDMKKLLALRNTEPEALSTIDEGKTLPKPLNTALPRKRCWVVRMKLI